ncbi:hypothetical protein [Methylomonas sp. ZR1]|uniref:hypothetical protein n=1 Tax=Methylomonas sp. ZR1 TaxID=1797072 RepID=UPI001490988E|nr:hypothetical protein [Methylomonas sp. ZR1]NOV28820.1 hypothetical protein [Methylomonas sp. ZR1]
MSIHQQVNDAIFLAEHNRHVGAFTLILLAIGASARKVFPEGTKKDHLAFKLFLGGRLRRILLYDYQPPEYSLSTGFTCVVGGKETDITDILYKYFRCSLAHEGKLATEVKFNSSQGNPNGYPQRPRGMAQLASWSEGEDGGKLTLDHIWIDILLEVIFHAPCNASEFGLSYFTLVPMQCIDESDFQQSFMINYEISPRMYYLLKEIVCELSPNFVLGNSESIWRSELERLSESRRISDALAELSRNKLLTSHGEFLPNTINALQEIAHSFERVPI